MTLATADTLPRYSIANTYSDPAAVPFRYRACLFAHLKLLIDAIIAKKGSWCTEYYWGIFGSYTEERPHNITLMNLETPAVRSPKFHNIVADGTNHLSGLHEPQGVPCAPPCTGLLRAEVQLLVSLRTLFRFPFFHWMPEQVRAELLIQLNLGFGGRRTTYNAAMRGVQSAALLSARQLRGR